MAAFSLICLGLVSGAGAGLLAGLVGIGGGIVIVPVIYYGLLAGGFSVNEAAHIAIATSLAAILPTAVASTIGHWSAGNTDFAFLREWGPGIAVGVFTAQLAAPYVRGGLMTGVFALFTLIAAIRFAAPGRFRPLTAEPPNGNFRHIAGLGIGVVSGLAGVGGGIMTNMVITLTGLPMHKSIGRAAAVGVVVSLPTTLMLHSRRRPSTAGTWALSICRCGLASRRHRPSLRGLAHSLRNGSRPRG